VKPPRKDNRQPQHEPRQPRERTMIESGTRYPNESADYRRSRNELLGAELEARRAIERAAELRRRLPLGGEIPEDYEFTTTDPEGKVDRIRMSALFKPDQNTLLLYSFMFGPDMDAPCPSCASILDALDGELPHLEQRVSFAAVIRSPIERVVSLISARGWRHLRVVSSEGTSYNHDYHGEDGDGSQQPTMNVFEKNGDGIFHLWGAEEAPSDPGQEPRNLDLFWPLWHLLDLTREGRGGEGFPRLWYDGYDESPEPAKS